MNLIFYSGGTPAQNEGLDGELRSFLGGSARITYIPSDSVTGELWFQMFKAEKRRLGLRRCTFFPVDRPFSRRALTEALASDAIYLPGGNTFHFLEHLRRAKMLPLLRRFAERGRLLFGLSAGSILMTPTIEMAGLVPGESDANDRNLRTLTALGLVRFEVYPHFTASEQSVRHLVRYSRTADHPIYAFPDGSGIVVRGGALTFHGEVTCIHRGKQFALAG